MYRNVQKEKNEVIYKKNRYIKYMKEFKRKSILVIIIFSICLFLLILNNIKTYNYCRKLNSELLMANMKYSQQVNNSEKAKLLAVAVDSSEKDAASIKVDKVLEENDKLKKYNKELEEDNISLQNSLKIAAMVGIKPKNYTHPPEITSRSGIQRERYIGKFKGTAYTPSKAECGNNKGITYSGKPIIPGTTIAVDTKYWPIGTVFYIKGIGYVTAMDTGNKVKGKDRFDFAVLDKKFAYALGSRYWDVYLVKKGNGKIE